MIVVIIWKPGLNLLYFPYRLLNDNPFLTERYITRNDNPFLTERRPLKSKIVRCYPEKKYRRLMLPGKVNCITRVVKVEIKYLDVKSL